MTDLILNCWVLDDDPDRASLFTVSSSSNKTVSLLKDNIKAKKNRFKDLDADSLHLFRVSIPIDENLATSLKETVPPNPDIRELFPDEELSELYLELPAPHHLHIIVRSPCTDSVERARFDSSQPPIDIAGNTQAESIQTMPCQLMAQEATLSSPDACEPITELSSVTPGQQNASLESVQNYLDEATHSDMDKMVLDVLLDEVLILNVVAKYSEGELDPKCASRNHVAILMREQPELREVIAKAFETKSFRDIRNSRIFRPSNTLPFERRAETLKLAHKAFSNKWLGDGHHHLVRLMDQLRSYPNDPRIIPYTHSISIVQSSGTGKSRLVDAAAQLKFCFPFNVQDPVLPNQFAYPPADRRIRQYFHESISPGHLTEDEDIIQSHMALFAALFQCAVGELQRAIEQTSVEDGSLPKRWHKYLAAGTTERTVGNNRNEFYHRVVVAAKKHQHEPEDILQPLVVNNGKRFVAALRDAITATSDDTCVNDPVLFFIYLDGASFLTKRKGVSRSGYHLLGRVLAMMNELPSFAVFLSTKCQLGPYRPFGVYGRNQRSASGRSNVVLRTAVTQLPFDTFVDHPSQLSPEARLDGKKLRDVCTLEYIVQFGRPLWASLYESGNDTFKAGMIEFAKMKLLSEGDDKKHNAQVTALSIRIILDFGVSRAARKYETMLIESHLRVAYVVPQQRFLRGGAPSEPLLAEAAAQLLNAKEGIQVLAPDVLRSLLPREVLANWGRVGTLGRMIWTIAHDIAIQNSSHDGSDPSKLVYHQPILLVEWLKSMVNSRWHRNILDAKPIADPDGLTLEEAFEDVYLHFTHFVRVHDHSIISPDQLWYGLVRGLSYEYAQDKWSTSVALPALHGGLDAFISAENTAIVYGQYKNRGDRTKFLLDPHIGGAPRNDLPTLSLVHDFGFVTANVYSYSTLGLKKAIVAGAKDIHRRHYQLHFEGITNQTYHGMGLMNIIRP